MFNNFVMPDLYPAIPEIIVLVMASAILLIDVFLKNRDPERNVAFFLTQVTLLVCMVTTFALNNVSESVQTFGGMFVSDLFANVLKFFIYFVVSVVLFYSRSYILDRPNMAKGEYYVLALFAMLGMMVMVSANHFLVIYLGIEMLSLSLYAMVALNRDSRPAVEAAMKYFVLGSLASGLLLYGMSMIYGATGTLNIQQVADSIVQVRQTNSLVLILGLVFLVSGIAFKLGVVPFHMWVPDVYHGAPTAVTVFIATAPKLAAFAVVIRLLVGGLHSMAVDWQGMLIILSVLSMLVGNLAAIAQTNIKRMLAYSGISHMGFMLLGVVSGVPDGTFVGQQMTQAYGSAMFYVIVYVIMTLGAFGMVILMARSGFEADQLNDFKGLNKRNPWLAAVMMFIMISMAGIPPFLGFFAKFSVLSSVVNAGWIWLAILAVIFSLIGAFYYLRVVKLMYFDEPDNPEPVKTQLDMQILISTNGLAVVLLGILPNTILELCYKALLQ